MENKISNKKNNIFYIIPIVLIVFLIPLIVHFKNIPLQGASYDYWKGTVSNVDFFSYYKAKVLLVLTLVVIIFGIIKFYNNNFKLNKLTIVFAPILIYFTYIILSTIFCEYKEIALWGYPDRYEGMFVLATYMIILFFSILLIDDESQIKLILGALLLSAIIIAMIGVFQYFGHDIWKNSFGKSIMFLGENDKGIDLNYQFGKKMIYSTLYHYNYVGSYMAMLFPLTFAMFILIKNKFFKGVMGIVTILMAACVLGSCSRAGIVGSTFAVIFLLILINKYIVKHWKKTLIIVICIMVAGGFGLNKFSDKKIMQRTKSIISSGKELLSKNDDKVMHDIPLKQLNIVNGNTAIIEIENNILKVTIENGDINFWDSKENKLDLDVNSQNGEIKFKDDRYKTYNTTIRNYKGKNILSIKKGGIRLYFSVGGNKIESVDYLGNKIDLDKVNNVPSWGFEGKERVGSSRGYIWSRAIPLLKDTIILGNGPDTFAAFFPQYDIYGKMYAYYGDMWQLVDKPHNLYLQIGLNTGVISLIAFLTLIMMYIVSSFKVYFKNTYEDFYSIVGVAIFAAVIGYLGAGFFNDSVVSVAPVFWVLLGMGISINLKLKNIYKVQQ